MNNGNSINTVAEQGLGDVTGPASSTDNAVARFDGTAGKTLQNSPMTVSDTGTTVSAVLTTTGGQTTTWSHDGSNAQLTTSTGFFILNGFLGAALRHGGTTTFTFTTGGSVSTMAAPTGFLIRLSSTGTTSHGLSGNDVLCGADLEVDGMAYLDGGASVLSDQFINFGTSNQVKMGYDTADADANTFKVGLPATTGNPTGMFMIGSQADIIGVDIGLETGDSYVFVAVEAGGATMAGLGSIDGIVSVVGVGTKAFQLLNPASGAWFDVTSDGTDTLMTPESGTELAVSGILKASSGVRGKYSTANVTNPPTDAELDSAFGTPATVGAGFTATLDDAGAGTAMYAVASDGTNWWYTLMTKAT